MDLQAQIQLLIDNAPQDGITPQLITAIAPALQTVAQRLTHKQYYVLQGMDEQWVLTTLSNRTNPELEKRVVYAYPTLQDAFYSELRSSYSQLTAKPIGVIHVLFQLTAMEPVDSIVFFETSGVSGDTIEIPRFELQSLIQQVMTNYRNRVVPPDIA
ncbi:hypothetical protein NIES4071_62420 [Calothrix sp. NIES-4071]|nr:hypothetical protein NIES4071_62420 [Calothrix sp. NIES-4071]BAZ60546.1 hypothetical protein NIES4105_62370 [Calothrix sp. NIES-4105]